ncbi:site-specific integrase [Emticicia sp. BO119]|uniref:site-specific integrase n=1 Tax=Emticicia sp. BO119 TaxID=2757768 RepID=UPI0015F063C2|nr:site-specific integrase [Emticicia sp. BO119]MBA4850160.1 phage integrase SAM-like domain-containing protein [Emticicia sp. BO119]
MASSVKIVLRKKRNSDGTYPLAVRVTIDRKTTYIYLGYNLLESDWDSVGQKVRKSHPNSTRLNNLLLKKKAETSDGLIDLQSHDNTVSLKNVRTKIKPSGGVSFFSQAKLFIENKKMAGKYNQEKPDQSRIDCFKTFLNDEDINFDEITIPLLNRFRAYLRGVRKLSERSIINHLLIIRTIYNQAVNSEIIDKKKYPFGKDKVQIKFPDSLKVGLNLEEVKQIEEIDLRDNSYLNHARNLWLISFYFAGIRFSDLILMKWSDLQNDRLFYSMGKNLKPGSLKVPEKALRILNQYRKDESKHDLIFPELKVLENIEDTYNVQRKSSYADKSINEALEKVATRIKLTKPLTMHISRHTFGNISGDKIDVKMLQKLYRHSDIRTTIGYQANFIHKTADDALDAVIGN